MRRLGRILLAILAVVSFVLTTTTVALAFVGGMVVLLGDKLGMDPTDLGGRDLWATLCVVAFTASLLELVRRFIEMGQGYPEGASTRHAPGEGAETGDDEHP
jgi:uncharacterized protein (DUF697 family)